MSCGPRCCTSWVGHGGSAPAATRTTSVNALIVAAPGALSTHAHAIRSATPTGPRWACGGWRIVKTMGMKLTKLRPVGGFCAETAGAVMLIGTAIGGIPVSTTHTITGSIMGVGAVQRFSAVRWGLAGRIVWAWILTIPLSVALAALTWLVLPHG